LHILESALHVLIKLYVRIAFVTSYTTEKGSLGRPYKVHSVLAW